MLHSMQHVSLLIIIYFLNHDQLINSCTNAEETKAGANRTITQSHTYYTCEITTCTFSKLNTYTV
jgi:hypothetical protein